MSSHSHGPEGEGAEADLIAGLSAASSGRSPSSSTSTTHVKRTEWHPNQELLAQLTEMGISTVAAKKALYFTGNSSVEVAAAWIFENPDADLETPLELEPSLEEMSDAIGRTGSSIAAERDMRAHRQIYKMVFVVNSELEMGVGKIAAQVAHAALGLHQLLLQNESKFGDALIKWMDFGETKIVLRGESTQQLLQLDRQAIEADLPSYLVQDAGKTQVRAGSTTVLSIFGRVDIVDSVTGHLKLL